MAMNHFRNGSLLSPNTVPVLMVKSCLHLAQRYRLSGYRWPRRLPQDRLFLSGRTWILFFAVSGIVVAENAAEQAFCHPKPHSHSTPRLNPLISAFFRLIPACSGRVTLYISPQIRTPPFVNHP